MAASLWRHRRHDRKACLPSPFKSCHVRATVRNADVDERKSQNGGFYLFFFFLRENRRSASKGFFLAWLNSGKKQFVGRSISVFLTFNMLLCTVYLCWTWLHCSCWSLNIGAFSNYLTVNQFYLFLCLQHSFTHTLPPHLTHYLELYGTGAEKRPAIASGIVTADARPILPRL